ncbi:immunoglobulin-like domain-containing protein [Acholeplasma hippikon]|uniref:Pesticidal crystal protein Cry22Aa Ig-like domain-containing protein n=1 Tax=Acholeplasma hippikon TaxID=264636 RepID=A0A449BIX9_9MOLU|nr:immunoglobulin-like domain-containing protein [Acholeplasma hippikon]VEU82416.1 Uncharacterised protein [Acholeplasma hippikon]
MKKLLLFVLNLMLFVIVSCGSEKDTTKPIILLSGGKTAIIVGDDFIGPQVSVTDNADDSIEVVISGDTIDTTKPGTYTLYYDATDSAGNKANQKSFTVTVYAYISNMDILNGGFETGNLSGWTIESIDGKSDAFKDEYVISANNRKEGTYFFDGSKTDDDKVGAIRSSNFILGGSGWINFRLGGGNDVEHLYLAIYRASDDVMIAKFANTNPQKYGGNEILVSYKFNLLTIPNVKLGDELYIRVVDTKLENWAIIKIDDIKTFNIEEPSQTTYETVLNQL